MKIEYREKSPKLDSSIEGFLKLSTDSIYKKIEKDAARFDSLGLEQNTSPEIIRR